MEKVLIVAVVVVAAAAAGCLFWYASDADVILDNYGVITNRELSTIFYIPPQYSSETILGVRATNIGNGGYCKVMLYDAITDKLIDSSRARYLNNGEQADFFMIFNEKGYYKVRIMSLKRGAWMQTHERNMELDPNRMTK